MYQKRFKTLNICFNVSEDLVKIGEISHFYTHIGVAVVELTDTLKIGDSIKVIGFTTEFNQIVKSMQIEHEQVNVAGKGDSIGLKVNDRVRKGDQVFKKT
jgi:putative protease